MPPIVFTKPQGIAFFDESLPFQPLLSMTKPTITYTIITISVVFDKIEKTIDKKLFQDYNHS